MKQLLFIIITFLFVSNVYAQSPAEILGKGKVYNCEAHTNFNTFYASCYELEQN
mgnify:CR=1 FL=1